MNRGPKDRKVGGEPLSSGDVSHRLRPKWSLGSSEREMTVVTF